LRASLLPLDGWLVRARLPDRARRPVLAGSAAVALVLVLAVGMAANAPNVVQAKYHEFTDHADTYPGAGESRLVSARVDGRFDLWHVALDSYRENRFHGTGAGTYAEIWNRDRPNAAQVLNAHSLYLEVLGELGLVGLVLLVIAVASILGAFAYRARGPDRALFAALLAAGLAWAIHAGVDWDWQMPAVTLWFFALGGAALARSQRRHGGHGRNIRNTVMRVGGVLACLGLAVLPARVALSQAQLNSAIGAMDAGDCRQARDDAHSALSAEGERPTPYTVIAFCDRGEGRYGPAVAAMEQALRRDPGNWELHYGFAVARAGAGLDPRRAARAAARLNPYSPIAQSAPRHFRGRNPAAWRVAARSAIVIPPAPGDP
ncbi:MAG: O-antigen ligase family protein, partial [Solirubrobacterales bacterium]